MKVPFNIPYISGNELKYIKEVINQLPQNSTISYITKCRSLLKQNWNYREVFLTTSCTSALEVCALLIDTKPGDEVIVPSYTFASTANAFLRQGATIIFADSRNDSPGIEENKIESLITEKTKAIVPVHYGGVACNMGKIMDIAEKHGLYVVEDAALAIGGHFKSKPLGGIGHLGCLSFHQTKNLQCGEGGAILINDSRFIKRALNILEKGTNRNEFISGTVERYEWVDLGSSFLMTELHAAFLFAQLEKADWIKKRRIYLWNMYYNSLKILEEQGVLKLPYIPDFAEHNAHTFYVILKDMDTTSELRSFLKDNDIQATLHYTSLDTSNYWRKNFGISGKNINSNHYNDCLLRLPLYNAMRDNEIQYVITAVLNYFNG